MGGWSQWREREEEGESCMEGCDTLAAIYESVYGKRPSTCLRARRRSACRAMCSWEERMAAVVSLNEVWK